MDFDNMDVCKSPHTVAALLKLYLRELPEPLLTFELYDCFQAANGKYELLCRILSYMSFCIMNFTFALGSIVSSDMS